MPLGPSAAVNVQPGAPLCAEEPSTKLRRRAVAGPVASRSPMPTRHDVSPFVAGGRSASLRPPRSKLLQPRAAMNHSWCWRPRSRDLGRPSGQCPVARPPLRPRCILLLSGPPRQSHPLLVCGPLTALGIERPSALVAAVCDFRSSKSAKRRQQRQGRIPCQTTAASSALNHVAAAS